MSVCVCVVPFPCNIFKASQWPSGHMFRLSFTMASVSAVLDDGISTLKLKIYIKKCTSLRLVISRPPWLSFTMASVPAVLHDGISTLKMKIYIKKRTVLSNVLKFTVLCTSLFYYVMCRFYLYTGTVMYCNMYITVL